MIQKFSLNPQCVFKLCVTTLDNEAISEALVLVNTFSLPGQGIKMALAAKKHPTRYRAVKLPSKYTSARAGALPYNLLAVS